MPKVSYWPFICSYDATFMIKFNPLTVPLNSATQLKQLIQICVCTTAKCFSWILHICINCETSPIQQCYRFKFSYVARIVFPITTVTQYGYALTMYVLICSIPYDHVIYLMSDFTQKLACLRNSFEHLVEHRHIGNRNVYKGICEYSTQGFMHILLRSYSRNAKLISHVCYQAN